MFITAVVILGLLLVPPVVFVAIFREDLYDGHPPAIVIPYLYLILGFRFLAPLAAALAMGSGWLAISRHRPGRLRYWAWALGIALGLASGAAWLHDFR